jgi:alpha-mannosidase
VTRLPLYYTFGNHMHWVDMEWLWGYNTLPGSARDMLAFCAATGAQGNLNFDGIGYEKLAAEAPEVLAELKAAVAAGQIEVVGASYGQPYGLFHGGESNVRQRVYGARTVRRLLGVWPKTFWEEEFDFFPQLPQILRGVGYAYASLFFQWTWHTPHVPVEEVPAVWWEGQDGSRLLTATRNKLNLHQWPEDFAGLLESPALRQMDRPGLVQWLELMPSPDWMCRSELMLPKLKELLAHPEFELRCVTLPEYLEVVRDLAVPRRYTMDDVFHGMSLGKNGDLFRRLSRDAEHGVLAAEALSALSGYLGRPYPGWDVYPVWELEEAWRELLAAQHHDNDECEGLCGHVGRRSYERSQGLSEDVINRSLTALIQRTQGPAYRHVIFNPLGWSRPASLLHKVVPEVPPFGYVVVASREQLTEPAPKLREATPETFTLRRGALSVTVNRASGRITQIMSAEFPEGVLRPDLPLGDLSLTRSGEADEFVDCHVQQDDHSIQITRRSRDGQEIDITVSLAIEREAVEVTFHTQYLPRPDPRMHAGLQTTLAANLTGARLIHDHPYGVSEVRAEGTYKRKYPTGDWMTSPQVFEDIHNPFTALQFVDIDDGQRGLLILHDGSQAWFREGDRLKLLLTMYDAWDADYFVSHLLVKLRLYPHGPLSHAERWRLAQEFNRPVLVAMAAEANEGDLPPALSGLWCDAPGVAVTAFYREQEVSGAHVLDYAGQGMGYPYVARLVELNGEPATATVRVLGPLAAAYKTNLLGQVEMPLAVTASEPPLPGTGEWSAVEVALRPYEIATLYLDPVAGRKRTRDLDAHRHVWATLHKAAESADS